MSEQEIKEKITAAYSIAKQTGITEETLLLEAFKYALGTNQTSPQVISPPHVSETASTPVGADDEIGKISRALGIDYDVIDKFYAVEDNELTLHLPTRLIPAGNTPAMKDMAIMLSVGRKHAGLGASTPFELIRAVCDDHGKLDGKNFAAAMSSLKPNLVPSGKGAKELVPKRPADELAKELIQKYNAV